MISFLKGVLVKKHPVKIEIDVSGVGYEVLISLSTYDKLPLEGSPVVILVHYQVREDAHILYGFISEEQRELFRMLIRVTRVGPKVALAILSKLTEKEFKNAVLSEDMACIASISGVGKKTSERIIMELKEKILKADLPGRTIRGTEDNGRQKVLQDAVIALESLGYQRSSVYRVCLQVLGKKEYPVEELVRLALRRLS